MKFQQLLKRLRATARKNNRKENMKINKRKRKLKFNATDAREWLESRADLGGVLMGLIDGTFSPGDVAKEVSRYTKEQATSND